MAIYNCLGCFAIFNLIVLISWNKHGISDKRSFIVFNLREIAEGFHEKRREIAEGFYENYCIWPCSRFHFRTIVAACTFEPTNLPGYQMT